MFKTFKQIFTEQNESGDEVWGKMSAGERRAAGKEFSKAHTGYKGVRASHKNDQNHKVYEVDDK